MPSNRYTPGNHSDEGKGKVINLYAAFGISLIMSLMPYGIAAVVSFIFLIGVLIAAYAIRKKSEEHSLAENHCTYIIRTIWIGGALSVVTIAVASGLLVADLDYSPFIPCSESFAEKGQEFVNNATYEQIMHLSQPCMNDFIAANMNGLVLAGLVGIVPILIYFAYRYVKGLMRALNGYRLADPKAWF
jgi:uncharacterized membrane protein